MAEGPMGEAATPSNTRVSDSEAFGNKDREKFVMLCLRFVEEDGSLSPQLSCHISAAERRAARIQKAGELARTTGLAKGLCLCLCRDSFKIESNSPTSFQHNAHTLTPLLVFFLFFLTHLGRRGNGSKKKRRLRWLGCAV